MVEQNINSKFEVMSKINYVVGDATQPQGKGTKIICHICNDMGAWGAGFVMALSNKWAYPEQRYRALAQYELGTAMVLLVDKEQDIYVANMIAQHRCRPSLDGTPPIRYTALVEALEKVNTIAEKLGAGLHMPRIGAGLAGGDWKTIETIIEQCTTVPVTVYDLP